MMEPVDHWRTALEAFGNVVAQVGEDQWGAPTPCTEWTVFDLVDHVAGFQRFTIGQLDAPEALHTPLNDDPARAWRAVQGALKAAVDAEGALDQTLESSFITAPFREALMLPTVDLMFHTWDLARAIGADETLPEATCEACYEAILPFDEAIRPGSGYTGYAHKIEPPPDADAQTRLLCFGGRQV